jgi:hypothetical protein
MRVPFFEAGSPKGNSTATIGYRREACLADGQTRSDLNRDSNGIRAPVLTVMKL